MALVVDSGPVFAALNRRESQHLACRHLLETATEPLLLPSPVVVEVDYWIRKWLHVGVLTTFFDDIVAGSFTVVDLVPEDYRRVRQLCDRYADSDIGFVDAAVLAIVERLNEPKMATLDRRHFGLMRPRHVDALQLLPE